LDDLRNHIHVDPNHIADAPDQNKVNECPFLLIRHAVTPFNVKFGEVVGSYGEFSEEYRTFKSDPTYIDISLLAEGVSQCERS
jgi:hypothetical protein